MDCSERIIIYVCVTNISGIPERRHTTLGEVFCDQVLGKKFQPVLDTTSYDFVHIPGDFDSPEPLNRWFILDLHVTSELSQEEVAQIPHCVYKASCPNNNW